MQFCKWFLLQDGQGAAACAARSSEREQTADKMKVKIKWTLPQSFEAIHLVVSFVAAGEKRHDISFVRPLTSMTTNEMSSECVLLFCRSAQLAAFPVSSCSFTRLWICDGSQGLEDLGQ